MKNIIRTPRLAQYFNNQKDLEVPYYYAMAKLKELDCTNVGLVTHLDSYEYPLFVIQKTMQPGRQGGFYPLFVENASAALFSDEPDVCAVMAIDQGEKWRPPGAYESWPRVFKRDRVTLYAESL
jgi:hypothetical protein